jgi:hypothetical protein
VLYAVKFATGCFFGCAVKLQSRPAFIFGLSGANRAIRPRHKVMRCSDDRRAV